MTREPALMFPTLRAARLISASLGLCYLFACAAPTETRTSGSATLDLAADERIVVYPTFNCLSDALSENPAWRSRVMSTIAFKDAMFPWFEAKHAPKDPISLDHLLRKPHVRTRIDDLNVRYLISLTSRNESDGFPGFICGAGYGGGGCLGLAWENNETSLDAVIWDLQKGGSVGSFSTESTGTSLAIGVILPIIFIAYTEEEACKKLANAITSDLSTPESR